MIVVSTPLRISLMGGGSDIPAYFETTSAGGACLSMAIDKRIHVAVAPSEGTRNRAMSDGFYTDDPGNEHHNPTMARIKACQQAMDYDVPLDVTSFSDIPSYGTGMGSSSAFTVGMLDAIHWLKYNKPQLKRDTIAEIACHVEINMCGEKIGKQDQYAAAYGGLRLYRFKKHIQETTEVSFVSIQDYQMTDWMNLYYTGIKRNASAILEKKKFGDNILSLVNMVDDMAVAIESRNYTMAGVLLDKSWQIKKQDEGVTNNIIDYAYERAMKCAIGGKVLGAGGGGYMFFIAEPNKRFVLDSIMHEQGFKRFDFKPDQNVQPQIKTF